MAEQRNNRGLLFLFLLPALGAAAFFLFRKKPYTPPVVSIAILPPSVSVRIGQTVQFAVIATLTDGSQTDITADVMFGSSNTAVAMVNATGLATGVGEGIVTITATHETHFAQAILQVTAPLPSGGIEAAGPPVFTVNAVQLTAPSQITVQQSSDIGVRWPARNTGAIAKDAQVQMVVIRNGVIYLHSEISSVLPGYTVSIGQDFVPILIGGTFWVLGDNEAHLHLLDLSVTPPLVVSMFPFILTLTP
jgi:hypothetical protein